MFVQIVGFLQQKQILLGNKLPWYFGPKNEMHKSPKRWGEVRGLNKVGADVNEQVLLTPSTAGCFCSRSSIGPFFLGNISEAW